MKKHATLFHIIILLSLALNVYAGVELKLVPQPREIQLLEGRFEFKNNKTGIILTDVQNEKIVFAAEQLKKEVKTDLEIDLPLLSDERIQSFYLAFPKISKSIKAKLKKYHMDLKKAGDEGYGLLVLPDQVIIVANTSTGVFYAVQTLKQLIRGHAEDKTIPCVAITDWPDMKMRGIMDDISRGPIPTMDYFKACIRRFAELKINMLSYYTENVVRTKKHGVAAPTGALSVEDIKELSAYANKYHIDLVGGLQSFGHFEKFLEYPQYEHLGEMGSLLSPAFEESYQLLADIYSELAPAYQSKYFAVLGDELWALGKGASESMVKEKGFARVFSDHMNRLSEELGKYDKKILVTADEPLKHPDTFELLNKDIILLPWDYSARESFDFMLAPIQEHGFDMIVTPGISCWRKIFPSFKESKTNIRHMIRDGLKYNALGVLNTTWDDWGINFFSNNWYGIAYGADQSWNSENSETDNYDRRFALACYRDQSGAIAEAITGLDNLKSISNLQNMEATVFWQKLFPEVGIKSTLSLVKWDDIKEGAEKAKKNIKSISNSLYSDDLEYILYACDQLEFMADFRVGLVDMAKNYRLACLNQQNRQVCRSYLLVVIRSISSLDTRWKALADQYNYLWLVENRFYWLENVERKFTDVEDDMLDVKNKLYSAMDNYDKSFSLPSPAQMRLDVKELSGNFFQTWLLCGSFPNPKDKPNAPSHGEWCVGFKTDYLSNYGGETGYVAKEGDRIRRPDGSEVLWQLHTTNLGEKIDLVGLFDQSERVVAYACCTIESPEDMQVTAALGSNDGIKVFLNGENVFQKHELRFVKIDEDKVTLNLKKGQNRLLLKIEQGRGKWGFVFRLMDSKIQKNGYNYKILQP